MITPGFSASAYDLCYFYRGTKLPYFANPGGIILFSFCVCPSQTMLNRGPIMVWDCLYLREKVDSIVVGGKIL